MDNLEVKLLFLAGFLIQAVCFAIVLINYDTYPDSVIVHTYKEQDSYGPKNTVFMMFALNLVLSLIVAYCYTKAQQANQKYFYAIANFAVSTLFVIMTFDMLEVI